MPKTTAAMGLSFNTHFPCPQVYDGKACRLLSCTRRPPSRFLSGVSTTDRCTPRSLGIHDSGNRTMPHNRKTHLIRCQKCFMGNPFVFGLGIERPQSSTILHDCPGTLGRLASGFPAKNNFTLFPRICLYMSNLKGNRDHMSNFTRLDIHLCDT